MTGCKPCDCDPGGSYDNMCDAITGQCRCRPRIEGRKCDRVIPGNYYALADNLKYEGEDARGIGVSESTVEQRIPSLRGFSSFEPEEFIVKLPFPVLKPLSSLCSDNVS